jgi:hypothetical protein
MMSQPLEAMGTRKTSVLRRYVLVLSNTLAKQLIAQHAPVDRMEPLGILFMPVTKL